eukprot:scaffold720_cov114-Cylindrotheca_fusiformis.AAC.15
MLKVLQGIEGIGSKDETTVLLVELSIKREGCSDCGCSLLVVAQLSFVDSPSNGPVPSLLLLLDQYQARTEYDLTNRIRVDW